MPIYEYECRKCKAHVEILQKLTDKPLTKCRKCGGRLEKQWSSTSFQFKGTGWYVTDYAAKKSDGGEKNPTLETKSAATETSADKPSTDKSKPKDSPATKKSDSKTTSSSKNSSGD